ncbi:MAG TPA: type II toxin-antitoxin system prevent-host-death family antitoxin [Candidatus Dormibacteraeota bacterium]|jgi:prevent-host-death family protein|nr:type II toxin-antitoxin system prevent-host-death family antitoxin [Candidatus Dormibacteraeota bacterium]
MRKVGLFEAKQKLSELVERASSGEKIGITRRGKLAAFIVSARPDATPQDIFDDIERIRKRARRTKKLNVKNLIEEGRE